jgi:hypothetical protein
MSVKVPLVPDLFAANGDLYAAYTGRFFGSNLIKRAPRHFVKLIMNQNFGSHSKMTVNYGAFETQS